MTQETKLYDIRKKDYPNNQGDTFRSLQIFECCICGALSNRVIMGGSNGYGVRVVCPNSSECWHHELEEKMEWLAKPHPQSYKRELQKEVDKMKRKNEKYIRNDVEGNPNMSFKRQMTNTFSRKIDSSCIHGF